MNNIAKIQLITLLLEYEAIDLDDAREMLLNNDPAKIYKDKLLENELKKTSLGKELL